MKASILCIGTELLKGKTVDTNSYYIARSLMELGYVIENKVILGDDIEAVINGLKFCFSTSDIIITIGGLGPTLDDITREAIAIATGSPLELNQDINRAIQDYIKKRYKKCPASNERQAYFPMGSNILANPIGTAPGFYIEKDGIKVFAVPGPPSEMKLMIDEEVLPYLKEGIDLVTKTISIEMIGVGESSFEETIADIIKDNKNITFGIYALNGKLSLTLTATGRYENEIEAMTEPIIKEVKNRYGSNIYSVDGYSLEEVVFTILKEKNLTLATAESCTGGLLSSIFTGISGASQVFDGGFVTYSNEFKVKQLGVPQEIINNYGAVSKETAMAMLKALKSKTKASCGISITGIAGPTGATEEKPVGLVYIGVYTPNAMEVYSFQFFGTRSRIQHFAANNALNLLRQKIEAE